MKSFDKSVQKALDQYEPDNQGYLKFSDIEDALLAQMSAKKRSRLSTIASVFMALMLIVFLGGVFGLVYLVVDINKDMRSMKGQLVDRSTGLPVQTANSDTTIVNGALVSRAPTSTGRRADSSTDNDRDIVSTVQYTENFKLSSDMSNVQLSNVLVISKSFGNPAFALNLHVQGYWTVPSNQAGKKSVIFLTAAGPYWLNGTDVTEADPSVLSGLFTKAASNGGEFTSPDIIHLTFLTFSRFSTRVTCGHRRPTLCRYRDRFFGKLLTARLLRPKWDSGLGYWRQPGWKPKRHPLLSPGKCCRLSTNPTSERPSPSTFALLCHGAAFAAIICIVLYPRCNHGRNVHGSELESELAPVFFKGVFSPAFIIHLASTTAPSPPSRCK